jgi:hypothetical protein
MPSDGPRPRRWLFIVAFVGAVALMLGLSVQAKREPPPAVQPYDPFPRW